MRNILRNSEEPGDVLAFVGANLRRFRAQAGISQAALAEASGVSRRMLVSLEKGDTNISLSSLDRIATALGVNFVALVSDPDAHPQYINALAWKGRGKDSHGTLLGSIAATTEVQLWNWSLAARDRYEAEADPVGWHEILFVTRGTLTLRLDAQDQLIRAGEHAIYSSAQPYAYINDTDSVTTFVRNAVL